MNDVGLEDDPTIPDDCELLRRVPLRRDINIIWDHNLQRWRPSSASFENHHSGTPMSITLRTELEEGGRGPADVLKGHNNFGLAAITAGIAREQNQRVVRDPLPEEPAHGLVVGKKTKSISRAMAKSAKWIIPPAHVEPPDQTIK